MRGDHGKALLSRIHLRGYILVSQTETECISNHLEKQNITYEIKQSSVVFID